MCVKLEWRIFYCDTLYFIFIVYNTILYISSYKLFIIIYLEMKFVHKNKLSKYYMYI